jgi:flagellar motor switch/type III secretory pathway protein FliN
MENLFKTRGRVEFVVARGWMSSYEAATMKAGDIVLSAGTAGTEGELTFNGEFIASAWLVVSGSKGGAAYFAARMQGFARHPHWSPEPEPGPALTDLLPFALIAAGMECSLDALEGAGPGSLLRFDTPFDAPGTMELRILGIPAARGPLAVHGELYGIRVDEVLHAPFSVREPQLTGALLCKRTVAGSLDSAEGFKLYDIRRPDAITRMTVTALERIHARFIQTLCARYPEFEGYGLALVDQMTAAEWKADFPLDGRRTIMAEAGRRRREYALDGAEDAELRVVEGPLHPAPLDPQSRAEILASLHALRDRDHQGPAEVHLPSGSVLGAADFFACLRSSWNLVADLAFRGIHEFREVHEFRELPNLPVGQDDKNGFVPNEMVVAVRFEKQGSLALDLAYTLRSLAAQIPALEMYGRAAF